MNLDLTKYATPRTDALLARMASNSPAETDHARQLERELAATLEALQKLATDYIETVDGEWGKGKGEKWLPESVKAILAATKGEE